MARTRAHTLQVVLVAVVCLAAGWLAGRHIGRMAVERADKKAAAAREPVTVNSVSQRRKEAIKEALRNNKTEYEFIVDSPPPLRAK